MNSWRNVVFGRCIPSFLTTMEQVDCPSDVSGSLDIVVQMKDITGNAYDLPSGLCVTLVDTNSQLRTLPLHNDGNGQGSLEVKDGLGVEATVVLSDADGYQVLNGDGFKIRYIVDGVPQDDDYARFSGAHKHKIMIECIHLEETVLALCVCKRNEVGETLPLLADDCFAIHVLQGDKEREVVLDCTNDFQASLTDMTCETAQIWMAEMPGFVTTYQFAHGEETSCGELELSCHSFHEVQVIVSERPANMLSITKLIREQDGTLVVPQKDSYQVHILGSQMDQIIMLNEANHYTVDVFHMCPGIYTVYEEGAGGYVVSYIIDGQRECPYAQVEMNESDSHHIMMINAYPQLDVCDSRLRICKYIRDDYGHLCRPCAPESFKVMLSGCGRQDIFNLNESNNWCVDIDTICNGYYEVMEIDCNDYITGYIVNNEEETTTACIQVSDGFSNCVKVVNTQRCKGIVTISKFVRNECGELVKPQGNAVFYASLKSYFMKECFTLQAENDWCVTFENLREGSYEVKEQALDDMDTWYIVNGCANHRKARFIVEGSNHNEVKIINEDRVSHIGNLSICKVIETHGGALVKPSGNDQYEIRLEGNHECVDTVLSYRNGWRICATDLSAGTYHVSELQGENVRYLVDGCEQSNACVEMDECDHEIVIINREEHIGKLTIGAAIEDCDGCMHRPDEHECFTVLLEGHKFSQEYYLSCENNWCIQLDQLPKGRYRIYQKDDYGYLVSYEINGLRKNRGIVNLQEDDVDVTIINQMRTCVGRVGITKWLCIDDTLTRPDEGCYTFELTARKYKECFTLDCENQFMTYIDGLEEGKYTLKEIDGDGRFLVNGCQSNGSFVLGREDIEIQVINDIIPTPNVTIEKQLRDECGALCRPCEDDCFEILIEGKHCREYYTLDYKNDWKFCLENLAEGMYHIYEKACGYEVSFMVNGECRNDGSFVVGKEDVKILIINEMMPRGNVDISKWIRDDDGSLIRPHRDECFEVKIEGEAYCQVFDLNYENHWRVCVEDLRPGRYEIKEALCPEYDASFIIDDKEMMQGKFIVDMDDVEIKVVNRDRCMSELQLCAFVSDGCDRFTPMAEDQFTICISGDGQSEQYSLNCDNDWSLCLDQLYGGSYRIQNLDDMMRMEVEVDGQIMKDGMVCLECVRVQVNLSFMKAGSDVYIRKCMIEDDCLMIPTNDQHFMVKVTGKGLDETIHLTHRNQFETVLHDVKNGCYEISELQHEGYEVIYQINGCEQNKGMFEVNDEDVQIVVLNEEMQKSGVLSISAVLRDGNQIVTKPHGDMKFHVEIEGVSFCKTVVLNKANQWQVDLAGLMPGRYSVVQELPEGIEKIRYAINHGREQNHAMIHITDQDQQVEIINVIESELGSITIRKYISDKNCGCLSKPCGDEVYQVMVKGMGQTFVYELNADNHFGITVEDLMVGEYEVVEMGNHHVTYIVDGGKQTPDAIVMVENDSHMVSVVNHPSTGDDGSITVSKWIRNDTGDLVKPTASMRFQVMVEGKSFSKLIDLNAMNQWQERLDNLANGTYQIIEQSNGENEVTYIVDDGMESEDGYVRVNDSHHEVQVVNRINDMMKGSITLRKLVRDVDNQFVDPSPDARYRVHISKVGFNQTITLDRNNNFTMTLQNLNNGNYAIEELGDHQATYIIDGGTEVNFAVVHVDYSTHNVDIINQEEIQTGGSIQLSKHIRDDMGNFVRPQADQTFDIQVSKAGFNVVETLQASNQWTANIQDLAAGNYSVMELDGDRATYIINDGSEVDFAVVNVNGDENSVRVINPLDQPIAGSIQMCKYIRNAQGQFVRPSDNASYIMHISGPGVNENRTLNKANDWCDTISNLTDGNYVLQEITTQDRVSYIINQGSEVDHALVRVQGDMNRVQVINTATQPMGGSIQLCKYIRNSSGLLDKPTGDASYQVRITSAGFNEIRTLASDNAWCIELNNLARGNYTISEVDNPNKVSYIINNGSEVDYATVIVNDDRNIVQMINYPGVSTGSITLRKRIKNINGRETTPVQGDEFSVSVMSKDFYQIFTLNYDNQFIEMVSDLPQGSYTVEESNEAGDYQVTYRINGQSPQETAQFMVNNNANSVDIINELTVDANNLEFLKFIVQENGTLGKPKQDEQFIVHVLGPNTDEMITLNAENNWYFDMRNLPNGDYTLQEVSNQGYQVSYIVNGGEPIEVASFFVGPGVSNLIEILNTPAGQTTNTIASPKQSSVVSQTRDDHTIRIVID